MANSLPTPTSEGEFEGRKTLWQDCPCGAGNAVYEDGTQCKQQSEELHMQSDPDQQFINLLKATGAALNPVRGRIIESLFTAALLEAIQVVQEARRDPLRPFREAGVDVPEPIAAWLLTSGGTPPEGYIPWLKSLPAEHFSYRRRIPHLTRFSDVPEFVLEWASTGDDENVPADVLAWFEN